MRGRPSDLVRGGVGEDLLLVGMERNRGRSHNSRRGARSLSESAADIQASRSPSDWPYRCDRPVIPEGHNVNGMRIVKVPRIREYAQRHDQARHSLERWLELTKFAEWMSLADVQCTFRHADQVTVKRGRTVVVFNIKGNDFRLVTAIHYNRGKGLCASVSYSRRVHQGCLERRDENLNRDNWLRRSAHEL